MSPTSGEARPDPKARTLARGPRRYRRKVASPKQWQAIIAAKLGPCRSCCKPATNGGGLPVVKFHHVVTREDHGDDVEDNLVPLCEACHIAIHMRWTGPTRRLLWSLSDAEYAYAIQ